MSDGFVYWYETGWDRERAESMLEVMERHGVSAANPRNGAVTMLSGAEETAGDQIRVDRRRLVEGMAEAARRGRFTFQLWFDAGSDLAISIDAGGDGVVVVDCWLDGVGVEHQVRLLAALAQRLGHEPRRVIGVVVDRGGGSDVVDWDAVVVTGTGDVPVRPELLAVRRGIGERVGEPSGAVRFHHGLVFGGDAELVAALTGAPGQGRSIR